MTNLSVSAVGRAVALSALLPRTAAYYLKYFEDSGERLTNLLAQRPVSDGDPLSSQAQAQIEALNADVAFVIFHLCFCSPEFGDDTVEARRWIPYQIDGRGDSDRAHRLEELLVYRPWQLNAPAVNAADMAVDYILGKPLAELEARFENLRGGMILDMMRTLASHLSGLADILAASATASLSVDEKLERFDPDKRKALRQIIRRVRQYAMQCVVGVPEDVMWMLGVTAPDQQPLIRRSLAMKLRDNGLRTVEDILDRGRTDVFIASLAADGNNRGLIERIRQGAQRVRSERTEHNKTRIVKRHSDCAALAEAFFKAREREFEDRVNDCFKCLEMPVHARDEGERKKSNFPDFVVEIDSGLVVVIECKSSTNGDDIPMKRVTEVGGKALAHGLNDKHMISLCQQYVSTDVPRHIESAKNLSVINAEDFAVALAYLKSGSISKSTFASWLTTPGQPRIEELFRR